ncbi:hypothetical protein V6Z12_D12G010000 [Gossypium hirsutum]
MSRIKHELHSIKKGELIVKEYIAKIQNTCALLEAFGSIISEAKNVEVILAGLLPDFDAVLTLVSFLSKTLPFQKIVDVLLEFESRQTRVVHDVSMHANMVQAPSLTAMTESDLRDIHSGHSTYGSRGRVFRPRIQCQIYSRYSHLAQRYFYRFNRDYDGPTALTTVRFSSAHDGQELHSDLHGRSTGFSGPG